MRPPPPTKSPLVVRGHSITNPSFQPSAAKRPSTTTMKRSGSIGNLPRATIVPAQRGLVHSATVEDHQITTTSCALHSIQRESLPEKYARSLEQQIHLLELENNFLKRTQPTLPPAQPPMEVDHERYGKILSRGGNEVSVNGRDWCRLPSFHPNLEKVIAERAGTSSERVETAKEQIDKISLGQSTWDPTRRRSTTRTGRVHSPETDRFTLQPLARHSPDAEILQQLEEKNQEVDLLSSKLRDESRKSKRHEESINKLTIRLKEAESDLSSRSEAEDRGRRALMTEVMELQRRLDDLTPVLAEKESRVAKIENERDALVAKMRSSSTQINELTLKLSERDKEEAHYKERENTLSDEINRLRGHIDQLRNEINQRIKKENELLDEITDSRRELQEAQLHHNNDRKAREQIASENVKLISENSRLTTELAKLEYNMDRLREEQTKTQKASNDDELIGLRLKMKAYATQATILEERLKASQFRYEELENEMQRVGVADDAIRHERERMQKELEALQALSRSLSDENNSLREEKHSLAEKVESVRGKLLSKELHIKNLEDLLDQQKQKTMEDKLKAEEETKMQNRRALDLEELSRRVRELSESYPTDSSVSTRRHTVHSATSSISTATQPHRITSGQTGTATHTQHRASTSSLQPRSLLHMQRQSLPTRISESPELSCFEYDSKEMEEVIGKTQL